MAKGLFKLPNCIKIGVSTQHTPGSYDFHLIESRWKFSSFWDLFTLDVI